MNAQTAGATRAIEPAAAFVTPPLPVLWALLVFGATVALPLAAGGVAMWTMVGRQERRS